MKLDKGWNGKFQIINAGYGPTDLEYRTVNSNEGKFGIVNKPITESEISELVE